MKLIPGMIVVLFLCLTTLLTAQGRRGEKVSKITPEDFTLSPSPVIDGNTNAVIMSDLGIVDFTGNNQGWFSYVFRRRTRIKILNKKAFDLATVEIPLYSHNEDKETLSEVSATTYNLENGALTETKLGKNDVFSVKIDKNRIEQKFTMPAVKEGSIIEYAYTVTSDFIFNIPAWEFQNINYPCLWSEYQVTIPNMLVYVFEKHGIHPFSLDKADQGHANYMVVQRGDEVGRGAPERTLSVSTNTIKHRWAMKDLPAFYVENYLTAASNYLDKIEFQLHQTYNGESTSDVMPTWKKATEELLKREDFAAFMDDEENAFWMDKALEAMVKPGGGSLQQAKDIYYYLANNFTCTSYYNKYIITSLQDVFKKRSGNVGELNLLLTALLRKNHIAASPVLLSTREYGYNYPGYPIMDRLNYVICRVTVDGNIYYLDASHAGLGFGEIPGNCYNGHARVISRSDSASVYFMSDSIKERKVTMVYLVNDEKKGSLTGNVQMSLGRMESYGLRASVAGEGQDKYIAGLKASAMGDIAINNAWIDSLKQPENPVKINEEFTYRTGDNTDIIYFNPFMWTGYKKNPFAAAVRKYPVEMDYPLNDTYILTMEIPTGFEADELPKPAKVVYNGGEGSFEYLVQKSENLLQMRCTLKFTKANFEPDEYNNLREFFGYIVKKEEEQIVFKKKK